MKKSKRLAGKGGPAGQRDPLPVNPGTPLKMFSGAKNGFVGALGPFSINGRGGLTSVLAVVLFLSFSPL